MNRRRLGAVVLVLAVSVGLVVALSSSGASGLPACAGADRSPAAPAPARFADSGGPGPDTPIQLRSARTGRVLHTIADYGFDFTNNGIAYSPDGRYVYVTLIPSARSSDPRIERITVETGARRMIARGWEPALSPDGRELAYFSFAHRSQTVVVMNLVTGRTLRLDVKPQLGDEQVLNEAPPAWFGNSSGFVVASGPPPVANVGRFTDSGTSHTSQPPPRFSLITVTASAVGLRARVIPQSGRSPQVLAPVSVGPGDRTVMATGLSTGNAAAIGEITFTTSGPHRCQLLTIPNALVLGFDPTGLRVIFLKGHNPPLPREATIVGGRLMSEHRLAGWGTGALSW
jgi:hypothetical protein